MEITYVTTNYSKIQTARELLEPLGFKVNNIKMETIEIQSDEIEEVAKFSAKWASEKLKCNVLKNDTGLCIEALDGFPGPYTHYIGNKLDDNDILKLMEEKQNRKAYFKEVLAYCEYGKEPITFTGITEGILSREKQGESGWVFDYIFIPKGESKTLASFPEEVRYKYWDTLVYGKLAEYLKSC